jgi:hypothetical protein
MNTKVLRPLHPPPGQVGGGGDPVRGGEQPLEVELAHARDGRERGEVERLGVVPVGVVARLTQVDEQVTGDPAGLARSPRRI